MNTKEIATLIRKSTMLNDIALSFIQNKMLELLKNGTPGDIVECGCWMGGCAATLAQTLLHCGDVRTIRLFDSFDDICEPSSIDGPRMIKQVGGAKNARGRLQPVKGFYKSRKLVGPGNEEHVFRLLTNVVGYPKENVVIHKGWFQNTVVPISKTIDKIALLILDCDLYVSIKICLENLYSKLVTGGIVIIDDYHYYDGARLAVDEFLKNNFIDVKIPSSGYLWWQK